MKGEVAKHTMLTFMEKIHNVSVYAIFQSPDIDVIH